MNREELEHLVAEVQRRQTELNNVEVKAARAGTPRRLYEALSGFANRTGGGVILFGLDESADFGIVGVGNAHQLQADIGDLRLACEVRRKADRIASMSERLARVYVISKQMSAIKGAASGR